MLIRCPINRKNIEAGRELNLPVDVPKCCKSIQEREGESRCACRCTTTRTFKDEGRAKKGNCTRSHETFRKAGKSFQMCILLNYVQMGFNVL